MDKTENPWQIIDSKEIYENPWIQLTEYQVITPSGSKGIYGKVHMQNAAIGIIALDENDHIFLVGQYRFTLDEYTWEIPEGGGPFAENPLDTAKRELQEETGLQAAHWEELLRIHTSNSVTDEYGHVFWATGLSQHETHFDDTEDLNTKKIPFDEAVEWVLSGKITDSISIAGILKLKVLRDRERGPKH